MVSPEIEHVVGVHDAMDEADQQPARDQVGLARDDAFEQRVIGALGLGDVRVVPGDDVVGELPHAIGVAARGEELEGADADVARGHAGEHRAGQHASRACTRSPVVTAASERVVGMPSAAIASLTMYSRSTGPSAARPSPRRENGVGPEPLSWMSRRTPSRVDDLAEQDGPAVAELRHEMAELVAGIGHRDRLGAIGDALAGEDFGAFRALQHVGIEAELDGQRPVQLDQPGGGDRGRGHAGEKVRRQRRIGVLEREMDGHDPKIGAGTE